MSINLKINGVALTASYATNGANQVCYVALADSTGQDVTEALEYTSTMVTAWGLARIHHMLQGGAA